MARRKAGFQKKPLGWLLAGNLNMSHQCALVAVTTNCTLAALARAEPAGTAERIFPPVRTWESTSGLCPANNQQCKTLAN